MAPVRSFRTRGFGTIAPVGGISPSAGVGVSRGVERIGLSHLAATAILFGASIAGVALDGLTATMVSCGAILLLGLPHGAFDMVALLQVDNGGGDRSWRGPIRAISIYLGLAGLVALLWWLSPGIALLSFFAVAIGHFGEDWPGPRIIALGAALALLAAPTLFHQAEIQALFWVIAGPGGSPPLATGMVLIAPVAIAAGLTACAILWGRGEHVLAISSAATLTAMVLLPPLVGFALTFGLFHSPRQYAEAARRSGAKGWRLPVAGASLSALLMVGAIGWLGAPSSLSTAMLRGTFITLSVLTVPHMLLPLILGLSGKDLTRRAAALALRRGWH